MISAAATAVAITGAAAAEIITLQFQD
jgi:hypothetical protein